MNISNKQWSDIFREASIKANAPVADPEYHESDWYKQVVKQMSDEVLEHVSNSSRDWATDWIDAVEWELCDRAANNILLGPQ